MFKKLLIGLMLTSSLFASEVNYQTNQNRITNYIKRKIDYNYQPDQMTIRKDSNIYIVEFKDIDNSYVVEYYKEAVTIKHERYWNDQLIYRCYFDKSGYKITKEERF